MPHRWSPLSTGAIKSYNNGKKIKKKKNNEIENNLVDELMDLGFSFEESVGCLDYLEKKDLNNALIFLFEIAPSYF